MEQSKIPKPGGNFTKIPLPSTKRSFSVANDSKIARPAKSFFGLKPPSIFQSKKLAAGEKYNSAKSFLHKKFATIDASTPSRLQRNPQQEKFYTPKEMARSDTFIREEDESPFARPQTEKPKKLFRTETFDKLEKCTRNIADDSYFSPVDNTPQSSTFLKNSTQTIISSNIGSNLTNMYVDSPTNLNSTKVNLTQNVNVTHDIIKNVTQTVDHGLNGLDTTKASIKESTFDITKSKKDTTFDRFTQNVTQSLDGFDNTRSVTKVKGFDVTKPSVKESTFDITKSKKDTTFDNFTQNVTQNLDGFDNTRNLTKVKGFDITKPTINCIKESTFDIAKSKKDTTFDRVTQNVTQTLNVTKVKGFDVTKPKESTFDINKSIGKEFTFDVDPSKLKPDITFNNSCHENSIKFEKLEDMPSPLFDADETLKPGDETIVQQQILSSTINTEKLVDVTNLSPRGILDVTTDSKEDEPVNTTDLLCMTQPMEELKNRYSFGLDLKDATLDCSIELVETSQVPTVASPMLRKQNSFEMDESLGILTPDQMKEFMDSAGANTSNIDLPLSLQRRYSLLQMRVDQTPSPEDLPLDPIPVTTTNSIKTVSTVSSSFVTSITSVTSLDNGYQGDGEMSRPASRGASERNIKLLTSSHLPPIRRNDPMTDSDFFTESDADDVLHRGDRRAQVIDGQLYGPTLNPTAEVPQHQQPMDDSCMDSSGIFTDVENRQEFDIEMSPDLSTDTVKMISEDNSESTVEEQKALQPNKCEEKSSKHKTSGDTIPSSAVQKCKYSKKNSTATSPTITQLTTPLKNEKCDKNNIKLNIRSSPGTAVTVTATAAAMLIQNSDRCNSNSKSPTATVVSPPLRKSATTNLTPNKWDAVMNKIENNKAQIAKKNYSEVKSKISTGVTNCGKKSPAAAAGAAAGSATDGAAKGNDSVGSGNSNCNSNTNSGLVSPQTKRLQLQQGAAKRGRSYSQQSSQSDLSSSGASPKLSLKTPPRAAKKRDVRNLSISPCDQGPPAKAHQFLNGSSSRLKVQQQHLTQKRVSPPTAKSNVNKQVPVQSKNSPKDQKLSSTNRLANGGGKNHGQAVQVQANILKAADDKGTNTEFEDTKDVESLGVLIQYLVYELDAFSTPQYKRDYEKAKNNLTKTILHLEEAKISCQSLQEQLEAKETYYLSREDELQNLHLSEITKVEDKLNELRIEANQRVQYIENRLEEVTLAYEKQLQEKSNTIENLQSQVESLNQRINQHINNENELRDNIHKSEIEYCKKIHSASVREKSLVDQINYLKQELEGKSNQSKEFTLNLTPEEMSILRTPSSRISGSPNKADSIHEIESLRCVLELKLDEIAKLKKHNQELEREAEENQNRSSKISTLENRLEDLQSKLNVKCEENTSLYEKYMTLEKKHSHDFQVRTQLSYDKEQLQYQLRQKAEQLHCLEEQFKSLNTSNLSCDEFIPIRNSSVIEIAECSDPLSPLKLSIQKPNSISWVLEMDDDTPRDAANKIVRRAGSFRSMSNPLSQSVSATAINNRHSHIHSNGNLRARSKSMSIKNNDKYYVRQHSSPTTKPRRSKVLSESEQLLDFGTDDVFESELPSKLITCDTSVLVKPNSKKLKNTLLRESAGEAMVSSANSEDEHCSASSEDLIGSASSSVTVSSSSSTTSLDRTNNSKDQKNFRLWEEDLSDIRPMDV